MRRLAALIMLTLLGACSTVDDLTPVMSSSSPMVAVRVAALGKVSVVIIPGAAGSKPSSRNDA